ncbi:hypothetical protein MO973_01975 [Paenibacillus sp. TRM 82003]|nr:hypothetical protein [Paenibacillus sp. TRM 82003]
MQEDFLDSVGDTLQHFADEIEEENKELLRMVGEMKREHESRTTTLMARIEQLERRTEPQLLPRAVALEAEQTSMPSAPPVRSPEAPGVDIRAAASEPGEPKPVPSPQGEARKPQPQPIEPDQETTDEKPTAPTRFAHTVKERYREVFEMYEGGKSIEYIAKKLGKNKGEIQLIIGLAKQEEPSHGQS